LPYIAVLVDVIEHGGLVRQAALLHAPILEEREILTPEHHNRRLFEKIESFL
jgi:hypothetical protein